MAVRFDTTGSLARNLDTKWSFKRQLQAKRHIFYIKETSLLVASGEEVEHSGDPQHHPGNLYLILQIFPFSLFCQIVTKDKLHRSDPLKVKIFTARELHHTQSRMWRRRTWLGLGLKINTYSQKPNSKGHLAQRLWCSRIPCPVWSGVGLSSSCSSHAILRSGYSKGSRCGSCRRCGTWWTQWPCVRMW